MQKSILGWRNRYSGEEGFVKSVSLKKGYFENTFNKSNAKSYVNEGLVRKDLNILNTIGETQNNDFFLIPMA